MYIYYTHYRGNGVKCPCPNLWPLCLVGSIHSWDFATGMKQFKGKIVMNPTSLSSLFDETLYYTVRRIKDRQKQCKEFDQAAIPLKALLYISQNFFRSWNWWFDLIWFDLTTPQTTFSLLVDWLLGGIIACLFVFWSQVVVNTVSWACLAQKGGFTPAHVLWQCCKF